MSYGDESPMLSYELTPKLRWRLGLLEQGWRCHQTNEYAWIPVPYADEEGKADD